MEKRPIRNVHTRRFAAPIELVRPWIEACWSATDRDAFPRDKIPTLRTNPEGTDPLALVPGVTVMGHGPFRFRLRGWDGTTWRVDAIGLGAWHGFDLIAAEGGCIVTHTLELAPSFTARLRWMAIAAAHDWAVEAIFDRIEIALRTGAVPATTTRPMPWRARFSLALGRRFGGRGRRQRRAAAQAAIAAAPAR